MQKEQKYREVDFKFMKLYLEFFLLYVATPLLLYKFELHKLFFLALWVIAVVCYLANKKTSSLSEFKTPVATIKKHSKHLIKRLMIFLLFSTAILAFTYIYFNDKLFHLVKEKTGLWVLIMILYPILSVIPQEIIYRTHYFERYKSLFNPALLYTLNIIAFSYAHLIFGNWIAVLFTLIGGYLFTSTYMKTKSLLITCIEHSAYGCIIFTSGLGAFFYRGTAQSLEKISFNFL